MEGVLSYCRHWFVSFYFIFTFVWYFVCFVLLLCIFVHFMPFIVYVCTALLPLGVIKDNDYNYENCKKNIVIEMSSVNTP